MYLLTKEQLLRDLHKAFLCARRHKASKPYVKVFERYLEKNLLELRDTLWNKTYKPLPATCFPISDPTKREIIAAQFRDCVVNHLYFNYVHEMFERTMIYDTYSCIKKRGTSLGVKRAVHHLRSVTVNYTEDGFILQKDIKGFFIHINRRLTRKIACSSLDRMALHKVHKGDPNVWGDIVDIPFVKYMTTVICLHDPTKDCIVLGSEKEWEGLPDSKSTRKAKSGYAFALGNLNSQILAGVLLNVLDQYVKRVLKCKHYQRSTDDMLIMEQSLKRILKINRKITDFLRNVLDLETNEGKTRIRDYRLGFKFLGVFIKAYRVYICSQTMKRIRIKLNLLMFSGKSEERIASSVNSFLGMMKHYNTFRMRIKMVLPYINICKLKGKFNLDYTVYTPFKKQGGLDGLLAF